MKSSLKATTAFTAPAKGAVADAMSLAIHAIFNADKLHQSRKDCQGIFDLVFHACRALTKLL